MAKLVELCGPSGVGKSSLYRGLQENWRPELSWVLYHDLYREKRTPGRRLQRFSERFLRGLRGEKPGETTAREQNSRSGKIAIGRRFIEGHPKFSSAYMDLITEHLERDHNGSDRRLMTVYYSIPSMVRVQTVREKSGDLRACLIDEGLFSRIMNFNSPGFDHRSLERYLEHLPVPDAVIYMNSSSGVIRDRIVAREKSATIHKAMSGDEILESTEKSQQMMEAALDSLKRSGVSIYRIDAGKPLEENVHEVMSILEGMSR